MKNSLVFLTAVLLNLVNPVFADDHKTTASEQINFAIKEGLSGNLQNLVRYSNKALNKALESSITAKSEQKSHINDAIVELQQAIEHGKLGHLGEAVSHARTAAWHIKSARIE